MAGFPAPVIRGAAQGRATAAVIFLYAAHFPHPSQPPPLAPSLMLPLVV